MNKQRNYRQNQCMHWKITGKQVKIMNKQVTTGKADVRMTFMLCMQALLRKSSNSDSVFTCK